MTSFQDLIDVNRRINEDSRYVSDISQYGVPEKMADIRTTGKGDCEDYGLGKLRELLAIGWDIKDLRLATCWTEPFKIQDPSGLWRDATMDERYHGVLVVRYNDVFWVLCNRKPYPTEHDMIGYKFDLLQIPGTALMEKAKNDNP